MSSLPSVLVLLGPTAAGKSSLALEIAAAVGGEIVNADSTQVYRGMDVGTDKTPLEERKGITHHLIDLVDPDQEYTAGDYVRDARRVISELHERSVPPIVVGGTGFYLRSLFEGLFQLPKVDPKIRDRLDRQADADLPALYARLEREDPEAAAGIEPANRSRIIRALEVLEGTGEPISTHWARHQEALASQPAPADAREAVERTDAPAPYHTVKLGITRPREALYERINERATHQIYDGHLEDEVRRLLESHPRDLHAFKALTYRHMIHVVHGEWTKEQALQELQRDTRHYAKRQLTWFRGNESIRWFRMPDDHDAAFQAGCEAVR